MEEEESAYDRLGWTQAERNAKGNDLMRSADAARELGFYGMAELYESEAWTAYGDEENSNHEGRVEK